MENTFFCTLKESADADDRHETDITIASNVQQFVVTHVDIKGTFLTSFEPITHVALKVGAANEAKVYTSQSSHTLCNRSDDVGTDVPGVTTDFLLLALTTDAMAYASLTSSVSVHKHAVNTPFTILVDDPPSDGVFKFEAYGLNNSPPVTTVQFENVSAQLRSVTVYGAVVFSA